MSQFILGIDASNLRAGGGLTHLRELLLSASPHSHNFSKVVLYGSSSTLSSIPDLPWLLKSTHYLLNKSLFHRLVWHLFFFQRSLKASGCNLLFSPGGSHSGTFQPVVTMSRNMLPFEFSQLFLYRLSFTTFRLLILRLLQSRSFMSADGVVFLSAYASSTVQAITGNLPGLISVIPHGIDSSFFSSPKDQYDIQHYTPSNPFRLIYVSIVDFYKHQWNVVYAISLLRSKYNWPLQLDLVGPSNPSAMKRLRQSIKSTDRTRSWVNYHGSVDSHLLPNFLSRSDLGIFASSCENMPNILLQTMASGLPIACSSFGPMPELLGSGGLYFNPYRIMDIADTLHTLINNPDLRTNLASKSHLSSQAYSWSKCADQTFSFLNQVASVSSV